MNVNSSEDESAVDQDDAEVVAISPPPPVPPPTKRTRRVENNGKKKSTTAKGKEKADLPNGRVRKQPSDEQMHVEEDHAIINDDEDLDVPPPSTANSRKKARTSDPHVNGARQATIEKYERDIQGLREELKAVAINSL